MVTRQKVRTTLAVVLSLVTLLSVTSGGVAAQEVDIGVDLAANADGGSVSGTLNDGSVECNLNRDDVSGGAPSPGDVPCDVTAPGDGGIGGDAPFNTSDLPGQENLPDQGGDSSGPEAHVDATTDGVNVNVSGGGGSLDCELAPPEGQPSVPPSSSDAPCSATPPGGSGGGGSAPVSPGDLPGNGSLPANPSSGGLHQELDVSTEGIALLIEGGGGSLDCEFQAPAGAPSPENPCQTGVPGGGGSAPISPGDLPGSGDLPEGFEDLPANPAVPLPA